MTSNELLALELKAAEARCAQLVDEPECHYFLAPRLLAQIKKIRDLVYEQQLDENFQKLSSTIEEFLREMEAEAPTQKRRT